MSELTQRGRRSWRALRTGTAFVVFGVGAILFGFVLFPLFTTASAGRRSELRVQRTIHRAFRLFVWIITALGLIRVTSRGVEWLNRPGGCVIVANHPTLIDVVLLIALLPQADCIVKEAVWRNPYMRRIVRAAGYIPNDAGSALTMACADRLRQGRKLLLFPEGTRSPREQLGMFRRGAARIALASGCEIVPVVIRCEPPTFRKGEPWFHVPDRTADLTLDVQAPMWPARNVQGAARAAVASRQLTEELRQLFEHRLSHAIF
jgi:1-acyl-sn-glycerol-3-phosphate acyltransferase